jgi:hypothetical protein
MEYFRIKSAKKDKKISQLTKDRKEMHEWKHGKFHENLRNV